MPFYDYYCPECGHKETIFHGMLTYDELPEDKKREIECPDDTCERYAEAMQKDYSGVGLMGASGGQFKTEKQLLREKQAERKLRSKRHFKSEVLPTLDETPRITKHFNDKLKDI